MGTMKQWMVGQPSFYKNISTSGSDYYVDVPTYVMANEHALVMTSSKLFQDKLFVLSLCMNVDGSASMESYYYDCDEAVNSSLLISSFAQLVTMDEWELFYTSSGPTAHYPVVRMKNYRKIYTITVGKLSWQTEDLAQVYVLVWVAVASVV